MLLRTTSHEEKAVFFFEDAGQFDVGTLELLLRMYFAEKDKVFFEDVPLLVERHY
ncbi:hypothetical protein [Thalassobacillus devorans]|uniref:hypothetical protein n=1 Tax=Thalassobacillus devorans TaxID=279813 RepID=UPI001376933A|nr:hypothetical protein [Thalassobacillus devorans]